MSHRTFNDPHGTSLEARQGLLDNRCEHGPKRHRTLGRRKRLSAKKKAKIKAANAIRLVAFRRWKAKVRAYWSGAAEEHPK
jgi:hypothetical protein